MDALVQRATLVVTGLLAAAGFLAPLPQRVLGRVPRLAWLLLWTGTTTAALQAPTQVLLANGGHPTRAIVINGLSTVPGGVWYGLLVLRKQLPHVRRSRSAMLARATS